MLKNRKEKVRSFQGSKKTKSIFKSTPLSITSIEPEVSHLNCHLKVERTATKYKGCDIAHYQLESILVSEKNRIRKLSCLLQANKLITITSKRQEV